MNAAVMKVTIADVAGVKMVAEAKPGGGKRDIRRKVILAPSSPQGKSRHTGRVSWP